MKLQFKDQAFQADAARAVVDVFSGQLYQTFSYTIDRGRDKPGVPDFVDDLEGRFTGWKNAPISPALSQEQILRNLQKVQRRNGIKPSVKLEGLYNLTIEMETGVGKTYTYIKTMYELNAAYGWSKFIIVVPSIAIREGVFKSFQVTQEHFAEKYGKKVRFFIYKSTNLSELEYFASDTGIHAMIINSQAFNSTGQDARRIRMKLDEFRSRRPIDVLAAMNPILIIDEPQSVEGEKTRESLKEFKPLLTLRYSATHRKDRIFNMVYRLDALDAYNQHLVKKIVVKGISETSSTATEGFVYLESVNLSKSAPTATLRFDYKAPSGVRTKSVTVNIGYNLYANSNELEEYKNNYIVKAIDGRDNSVEFVNGVRLRAGDVVGKVNESQLRRIQIRETIISHLERERRLFFKGIKVLSLFFIDEVKNYREYDALGAAQNGEYAQIFEEEYKEAVALLQPEFGETDYFAYLSKIDAAKTHAGYFSIDKKGKMTNSKLANRREGTSDDTSAYDLIMKNKELLLDRDPERSPVRFIFSHSALREGWDNPNIFQICTLKQSGSDVRKRQEVGRGLRLCVNDKGERMDSSVLGAEVQDVNVLTVVASESYELFAKGLQEELAESIAYRPRAVSVELFVGEKFTTDEGEDFNVDNVSAAKIYQGLVKSGYVDAEGKLTDSYYAAKTNKTVEVIPEMVKYTPDIIRVLDSVYDERKLKPEDEHENNVGAKVDSEKLNMKEFQELWARINKKSAYVVRFDSTELVRKAIAALDEQLLVAKLAYCVEEGEMSQIESKEELKAGEAFESRRTRLYASAKYSRVSDHVKYDLVGKLAEDTVLTRKDIVAILSGIRCETFEQFKDNPEEFISKAAKLINNEKATVIIQHITYNALEESYEATKIFTEPKNSIRKLGVNAMETKRNLYDHLLYDSENERKFGAALEASDNVAVYTKLPKGFKISTPVGDYNPDWAIAFKEGDIKHIYFVAETKGSLDTLDLREIESAKIKCAREHFRAISGDKVVYDVVNSYENLMEKVMR